MKLKICGIRDQQFLQKSGELDFDYAGFIFYPKSERYAIGHLPPESLNNLPPNTKRVGVFVNESFDTITDTMNRFSLDLVQLHGDESPEFVQQLSAEIEVIKAFRIYHDFDFETIQPYKSYCRYFLFDTRGEKYGGTGQKFNWDLLSHYEGKTPFLLSGGIGPGDILKIAAFSHPQCFGIDINSRFETEPGIKDFEKISVFIDQIK